MTSGQDHKFLIRADYYGVISTKEKTSFWLPKYRGVLYFDENEMHFVGKNQEEIVVSFDKIVKVKLESLNPRKNKWCLSFFSSPFYLLFWIPFWNSYIINITFFDNAGHPREMFFKLKTKEYSMETVQLLKKSMKLNNKRKAMKKGH